MFPKQSSNRFVENVDPAYTPPGIEGYEWIGNALSAGNEQAAIAAFNRNNPSLIARQFKPRVIGKRPIWAVYQKKEDTRP